MPPRPFLLAPTLAFAATAFAAGETIRVAIVVDDGPRPGKSEQWVRILAEHGARASFSYNGSYVDATPALAKAAHAAGHELNNHSYSHPHLRELSDENVRSELSDTNAAIKRATGQGARWFWAPFLESDARVDAIAEAAGSKPFPLQKFHFIGTEDWNTNISAAEIHRRATTGVKDSTVILFHEWRDETIEQLPVILSDLKKQGVVFVTFSELVGIEDQKTGRSEVRKD